MSGLNVFMEIDIYESLKIIARMEEGEILFRIKYIGGDIQEAIGYQMSIVEYALENHCTYILPDPEDNDGVGVVVQTDIVSFDEFISLIEKGFLKKK